jgi:hypothetical protein
MGYTGEEGGVRVPAAISEVAKVNKVREVCGAHE